MEYGLGFPHPIDPKTNDMVLGLMDADMIMWHPFPIMNAFSWWSPISSLWNIMAGVNNGNSTRVPRQQQQPRVLVSNIVFPWHNNITMIIGTRNLIGKVSPSILHDEDPESPLLLWLRHQQKKNNSQLLIHDNVGRNKDEELQNNLASIKHSYGAGPPIFITARDLYSIVLHWCHFAPKVHQIIPDVLAEMYAHSIAAAHLQLKHQLSHAFMVSHVRQPWEGWKAIDSLSLRDACQPPASSTPFNRNTQTYKSKVGGSSSNNNRSNKNESAINDNLATMPLVLHYCQTYSIGDYWFDKIGAAVGVEDPSADMLSCPLALFDEPPLDAGVRYDYYLHEIYNQPMYFFNDTDPLIHRRRQTFMTCTLLRSLNQAAIHYKQHQCKTIMMDMSANYNKSLRLRYSG